MVFAAERVNFAVPTPWSRLLAGEAMCFPPPGLACRLGRFAAERHRRSLTPSHALTVQKRIAYRHGRGRKLYSLIPKGGDIRLPPLTTPHMRKPSAPEKAICHGGARGSWCPLGTCAPKGGAKARLTPCSGLASTHPLPPPAPKPRRELFPRWRGRGI